MLAIKISVVMHSVKTIKMYFAYKLGEDLIVADVLESKVLI